jgi:signal transduction histidine kinase
VPPSCALDTRAAVDGLAARSPIPVDVDGELSVRPAPAVESALYFTIAEAMTNVAKYSGAGTAAVRIAQGEHHAEVEIRDDGRGGAEPARGSGLRGLVDRLGALGGHLHVDSPVRRGTTIRAVVPLDPRDLASELSCGCCAEGQCRCSP